MNEQKQTLKRKLCKKKYNLQNSCSTEYRADCMRWYDQNLSKIPLKKLIFLSCRPITLKRQNYCTGIF